MTQHNINVYVILQKITIALIIIYIGLCFFFMKHYYFNTYIGEVNCSGHTPDYVIQQNNKKLKNYVLTIYDLDKHPHLINGQDIDYYYRSTGEEKRILQSQNPFLWPFHLLQKNTYSISNSVTFSEEKLTQKLYYLPIFDKEKITPPSNARLYMNKNSYGIITEVIGNQPNSDIIKSKVNFCLCNCISELLLTDTCYIRPTRYANDSDFLQQIHLIDTYIASTIYYELGDKKENLDCQTILSFLYIKNNKVFINERKVENFVQELASRYNTYGKTRSFVTHLGDTISIGGGDYGFIIDKKAEKKQILDDLYKGQPTHRAPKYSQTALTRQGNEIGNTYIELDYTNQKCLFFKNGILKLSTEIVSGDMEKENGSPDGIFFIKYKIPNATLNGEDYHTFVQFFMPFAYNIGFHDASWRKEFGNDIYLENGSHGCINVPLNKMKILYNSIEPNTPVVAYYRTPVSLKSENAKMCNAYSQLKSQRIR